MAKTIIRPATSLDFPTLLEIDAASFPAEVAYDSEELSYFMNQEGAETIVLETDGLIAAFLIVDVNRKGKAATIVTLDVREDCRRLGFGSKLLVRSEEIVAGHNVETYGLQVDVHNAGAIAFYERHGFRSTRKLRHYYADGHDAWLMIKRLPQNGGKSH